MCMWPVPVLDALSQTSDSWSWASSPTSTATSPRAAQPAWRHVSGHGSVSPLEPASARHEHSPSPRTPGSDPLPVMRFTLGTTLGDASGGAGKGAGWGFKSPQWAGSITAVQSHPAASAVHGDMGKHTRPPSATQQGLHPFCEGPSPSSRARARAADVSTPSTEVTKALLSQVFEIRAEAARSSERVRALEGQVAALAGAVHELCGMKRAAAAAHAGCQCSCARAEGLRPQAGADEEGGEWGERLWPQGEARMGAPRGAGRYLCSCACSPKKKKKTEEGFTHDCCMAGYDSLAQEGEEAANVTAHAVSRMALDTPTTRHDHDSAAPRLTAHSPTAHLLNHLPPSTATAAPAQTPPCQEGKDDPRRGEGAGTLDDNPVPGPTLTSLRGSLRGVRTRLRRQREGLSRHLQSFSALQGTEAEPRRGQGPPGPCPGAPQEGQTLVPGDRNPGAGVPHEGDILAAGHCKPGAGVPEEGGMPAACGLLRAGEESGERHHKAVHHLVPLDSNSDLQRFHQLLVCHSFSCCSVHVLAGVLYLIQ